MYFGVSKWILNNADVLGAAKKMYPEVFLPSSEQPVGILIRTFTLLLLIAHTCIKTSSSIAILRTVAKFMNVCDTTSWFCTLKKQYYNENSWANVWNHWNDYICGYRKCNNFVEITGNKMPFAFGANTWWRAGNKCVKFHFKSPSDCWENGKTFRG